jgi:hypothetical protein
MEKRYHIQRLMGENIMERHADIMTIRSLREISDGLHEPIDDLLEMIKEGIGDIPTPS